MMFAVDRARARRRTGPSRGMSTTLKTALSTVAAMPRRSGVRASPAARNAPPSMKNTSRPTLPTNIVRRKGSAAAFTGGRGVDDVEQVRREDVAGHRQDDRQQRAT